jgi:glycosyltransferase involved in cell wall biosynthesis
VCKLAIKKTGSVVKKLTIVQILPALQSGGVERGTLEVAKELIAKGHRAVVISSGGYMVEELESYGAEHITLMVQKKSLFSLRHVKKLRKALTLIKPDVIHTRSRLPAWLTYLAWRKMPVLNRPKWVSTVHGLYSINRYSKVMTQAERVIVVSETAKKYVLDNYPETNEQQIKLIYRGIDPKQFPLNYLPEVSWLEQWKKQFPQLMGKKTLTLPGRITRLKGHKNFIRLIRKLLDSGEQVHGLIVGGAHPGKQRYMQELEDKIKQFNLQDDITFTGNRSDIRDVYAVSDLIFSLSNKPESFGRTVLEPLAMGRPVIAWDYGGVGEILAAMFPSGKVSKGDVKTLLAVTIQQLKSPSTPAIENPFLLQTMLDNILDLYQEMAHE